MRQEQGQEGSELEATEGYEFPAWLVVVDGNVRGIATREGNAKAMAQRWRGGKYAVHVVSGSATFAAGVTDTKTPRKRETSGAHGKQ